MKVLPVFFLLAGCVPVLAGCTVGYLARSARFQATMLVGREPASRALTDERLSPSRRETLAMFSDVVAFGGRLGLSGTRSYQTINLSWDRQILNLCASDPLAFEPVTWWFPIVGRVPYLGFFRAEDADRWRRRLEHDGADVAVRPVGAYSTLGWFRDPILPAMLDWSASEVAVTVLHEMTHATLWVPGDVPFNETLASVVGEEAALQWHQERYGTDSETTLAFERRQQDRATLRRILLDMYKELDSVYRSPILPEETRLKEKARIYGSLENRISISFFNDSELYVETARKAPWNNARLDQFHTYNGRWDAMASLLAQMHGDIPAFISRIRAVTEDADDPWQALESTRPLDGRQDAF